MSKIIQLVFSTTAGVLLAAGGFAQTATASNGDHPVNINQTQGFANGQLLVFTYLQNFACVDQPFQDLNHNGKVMAIDPDEFQRPICAVGEQPTIDPTGAPITGVHKLFVIAPFFGTDTNPNDAFNPTLGNALLKLFGFIPEAFKTHPDVVVQCPEPGLPDNQHQGMPGTCTTHTTQLDLGPVLAKLGKVPPNTNVFVPTLNHSHIIDETVQSPVWWQIISVLITDRNAWPSEDGKSGITSLAALREAQKNGQAGPDTPTNFFLFFGVKPDTTDKH